MFRTVDLIMIGLLIAGASWTFMVKHEAEIAMERVAILERQLAYEKEEIDLLKADWSLLNKPSRLQALVDRYNDELRLQQADPRQFVGIDQLPPRTVELQPPASMPLDGSRSADVKGIGSLITGSVPIRPVPTQPFPGDPDSEKQGNNAVEGRVMEPIE